MKFFLLLVMLGFAVACEPKCPDYVVDTMNAARKVSKDLAYDWNCNGAVDLDDVARAVQAAENCETPKRDC